MNTPSESSEESSILSSLHDREMLNIFYREACKRLIERITNNDERYVEFAENISKMCDEIYSQIDKFETMMDEIEAAEEMKLLEIEER